MTSLAQVIKEGKVVQLSYSLTNSAGQILDRADQESPFVYLHGGGQIVPGLEEALEGLKKGDTKKVTVEPEEGYGVKDPDLKLTLKRSQFPPKLDLQVGMQFETSTPSGEDLVFTVEKIEGDQISVDGNHPLAGVTLHFDVEVLNVRDATEEEMAHGHAHGDDGNHH